MYTCGKDNRKIEKLQDTYFDFYQIEAFSDKLVQSCAALVNLQTPMISGVCNKYCSDLSELMYLITV